MTPVGTVLEQSPGELALAGCLDYRNGKALSLAGRQLIQSSSAKQIMLDCAAVTRSSSVGLALILSLIRSANTANKTLLIKSLTEDLAQIAKFSGVMDLLPLSDNFTVIAKT